MRSSAVRLTCSAAALIALGVAGFFVVQSEKQLASAAAGFRALDLHAREAAGAMDDARAAQQAYVAAGQDNAFWMPKVTSTVERVTAGLTSLRETATDPNAGAALDQATNTVAMFREIDKRSREYLKSGQQLMAADVIFTEGGEAAATAARSIEAARLAERQAMDTAEAGIRKREAMAVAGTVGFAVLILLMLMPAGHVSVPVSSERADDSRAPDGRDVKGLTLDDDEWVGPVRRAPAQSVASAAAPAPPALPAAPALPAPPALVSRPAQTLMNAAAALATDFGRVRDLDDLTGLLGRAAEAMEATGLVVWVGTVTGADLRPMLAHGYSAQTLARIAPVARTDDNAAAAAYRSGRLQIVMSKPGASGAIVAPILVPDGCVGALSAEFRGGEASEAVQAFAAIIAANLATVLATAPAESIEPQTAQA